MSEIIKNNGSNKSANRLDVRRKWLAVDFWLFLAAVGCGLEWEYNVVKGRTWRVAVGEEFNSMIWVQQYTCHDSCRFSVNIW